MTDKIKLGDILQLCNGIDYLVLVRDVGGKKTEGYTRDKIGYLKERNPVAYIRWQGWLKCPLKNIVPSIDLKFSSETQKEIVNTALILEINSTEGDNQEEEK